MQQTSASGHTPISSRSWVEPLTFDDVPVRNQLLTGLGASHLADIKSRFETVNIEPRMSLFASDGSIEHVYFPETAVVSLVNTLREGQVVQEGAVGREGMVGLSVFLNGYGSSVRAVVDVPGVARRLDVQVFRRLSASPGPFHLVMLRYTQAFLAQVARTAACHGMHLLQERCAGWLLTTRERVNASEFPLSHELLSLALGARRTGVTLAMRSLEDGQLIRWRHGRVEIIDVDGLEGASCECHGVVRAEYARLVPAVA
jgi:CRP-like cAMP-binding protein